jgi:hypothetical protein
MGGGWVAYNCKLNPDVDTKSVSLSKTGIRNFVIL